MTHVVLSDACIATLHFATGNALLRQNQFDAAIAAFDAALRLNPDDPYAHWNRAMALLSSGDYARGFPEHDWAWRLFNWRGFGPIGNDIDRLQALPLWRGETGVHLLAYHELGFGDAIMAMRYLPELKRRSEVTLVVDTSLARLARSFDVEVSTRLPEDLSGFDVRLPLFGVMSVLQQTVETIPVAPYITGHRWQWGDGKLGIAWSGRTQTSFSLERFLSLLDHAGYRLHSLQPGPVGALVDNGVEPLPEGSDFSDVADRIAQMDHVVTVDTAAAHLAGAMGHPSVHLVLPYLMDWRWWRSSAWYPTLNTYRQVSADDWSTPFARLNERLIKR